MNPDSLLNVSNLSLKIGEKEILKNISFSLKQGEWLTIIGHNGSGKTSLLKSLLDLYNFWQGEISLSGQDIRSISRRERAGIMSYVPQTPPDNLHMLVKDFLLLSRYPYRKNFGFSEIDFNAVNEAADTLNLQNFLQRDFSSLSGGEKQKVLIASILVQETEIVFLDEPAASLDPSFTVEIMTTLKKIATSRTLTVIEVSHDINSAALFSDRILALKNGSTIKDIPSSELMNPEQLHTIYDHPFNVMYDQASDRKVAFPDYGVIK